MKRAARMLGVVGLAAGLLVVVAGCARSRPAEYYAADKDQWVTTKGERWADLWWRHLSNRRP
jgi:hypothetical protein